MENATNIFYFFSHQKYIKIMEKKLFSATIFFKPGTLRSRKYRNISNRINFVMFAKKADGIYINFYDQKTKEYLHRVYLK
jgi:DUF2075 family protein